MDCPKSRPRHRLETLVTVFTNDELDCDCDGTFHKDAAWWLARLACAGRERTIEEFLADNAWCVKPEPPEAPVDEPKALDAGEGAQEIADRLGYETPSEAQQRLNQDRNIEDL